MSIVEYTAQGVLGQLDKTTQEFYGFVMPAIETCTKIKMIGY
jgi:hypothetical protein